MRRISIFIGLKIIELACLSIAMYGIAWIGWLIVQLVEGEHQFQLHTFPAFFLYALLGIMITFVGVVASGLLLIGLYSLIKKNWEWSGRA